VIARRFWLALLVVSIALAAPVTAQDEVRRFQSFFVFSDSLGDTGNDFLLTQSLGLVPAIPPSVSPYRTYFNGRFSNGPILFEYVWAGLSPKGGQVAPSLSVQSIPKKGALSFAYGGSTSGTTCFPLAGLRCQVEQFAALLGGSKANSEALYAVFSGANDIINAPNPFDPAVVTGIVTNVTVAVERLYQLGARNILVFNMPNIGRSLRVQDPALKAALNGLALQHNAALAGEMAGLTTSLKGIRIIPIDVYTFLEGLVASSTFNFNVSALPPPLSFCLFADPSTCSDVSFDVDPSYFFWDVEHPSTSGHAATADFVLGEIDAFFN
jgi:phospholipase/lecithinase/hemolysin